MKEVKQAYDKWQCIEKEDDDIGMLIFSKNDLLNFAKYYHQSKIVLDDFSTPLKTIVFELANKLALSGKGDQAVKMHRIHNSL